MGSSASKYEAEMGPLPRVKPVGVLPDYTTHTEPIQLEFEKGSGSISLIREAGGGKIVFEVEGMGWGKTQLRECRQGDKKGRVLLNIYSSAWTWSWDVRGDNTLQDQVRVKPLLFKIKSDTGRNPVLVIKFTSNGKKVVWFVKQDKQQSSVLITSDGGITLGHAGLRQVKSCPSSTGLVLTVASGVDYAMLTTALLCRMQYMSKSRSHSGHHSHAAAMHAASAGSFAGTDGGGAGAGGC